MNAIEARIQAAIQPQLEHADWLLWELENPRTMPGRHADEWFQPIAPLPVAADMIESFSIASQQAGEVLTEMAQKFYKLQDEISEVFRENAHPV